MCIRDRFYTQHLIVNYSSMSHADAGAAASPTGSADGFTVVGRGGKPLRGNAPSGSPAAAPVAAVNSGGLVDGASTNAPTSTPVAVAAAGGGSKRASPKRTEQSPVRTDKGILDEILRKVSVLGGSLEVIGQRLDGVEQREAERVADSAVGDEQSKRGRGHTTSGAVGGLQLDGDDGDDDDSDGSSRTSRASFETFDSDASDRDKEYLVVDPKRNKHYGARNLAHQDDQAPQRISQHGNQVYDDLRASRAGADGVLGLGLRWLNPGCLYLQTGVDGIGDRIRQLERILEIADGEVFDELCELHADLVATYNTSRGAYDIVNGARTLVEGRARVQSNGATAAAKRRQQYVEEQLDDEAYADPSIDKRVRQLQAEFDVEAGKADLKRAASSGGATAGGRYDRRGGDRRDERRDERRGDSRGGKSKSQKRRERREREERDERGRGRDERGKRDDDRREHSRERTKRDGRRDEGGRRESRSEREPPHGGGSRSEGKRANSKRDDERESRRGSSKERSERGGGRTGKLNDREDRRGGRDDGGGRRGSARGRSGGRSDANSSDDEW